MIVRGVASLLLGLAMLVVGSCVLFVVSFF
jgi:hypothetical protein